MKLTLECAENGSLCISADEGALTLPPSFAPEVRDLTGLADAVVGLLNGLDRTTLAWPVGSWYLGSRCRNQESGITDKGWAPARRAFRNRLSAAVFFDRVAAQWHMVAAHMAIAGWEKYM